MKRYRGTLFACLLAAGALMTLCPCAVAQPGAPRIVEVAGVSMTVEDLATSVAFYRDVLSFKLVSEREEVGEGLEAATGVFGARRRTAVLKLGSEVVELSDYLAPEGRRIPIESKSNDGWFQHIAIVVSDMESAYAHLRKHNVRHASTGPQTLPDWNPNAGGIKAFYFKDPDGHPLEVIWFPAGKGDPKWQHIAGGPNPPLFMGIDHTAIVVKDTRASLAFYTDVLGMRVAGESENYGTEQEHLNNVFGARLRITGLRAQGGIGVEFLEYLAPSTGRESPVDAAANDIWSTQTILLGDAASLAPSKEPIAGGEWVSPRPADPDGQGPQPTQLMLLDPDRHAIVIRQQTSTHATPAGD